MNRMNRENTVKKETPPVLGESTHELSRSLHGPSQSQTAASLPSPGEAIETKSQKEPSDNAPHQPCCLRASLTKIGFEMVELYHVRLTHRVHM